MGRIQLLPDDVANKIAAGEVVERPASVVKELVENALDAEATRVSVYLEDGGKHLIRVVDDGCGMSADDVFLAVQPHATSKIHTAQDLAAIDTLGFRGEALPSIAAVSDFLMTSRQWDADVGTAVAIEGGSEPRVFEVGCSPGTAVTVRGLFYNMPARLKFLKTTATELGRIIDIVGRFALSHPEVGFTLMHHRKEVFRSDPSDDVRGKLADVLGRSAVDEMIDVHVETPLMALEGHVAKPSLTRTTRVGQYLFVNGRSIRSQMASHAAEQAYGDLLPANRKPVFALFITMDPRLVDPNVHPTKAEVRFARESEVYVTTLNAIRGALEGHDLAPAAIAELPELGDPQAARETGLLVPPPLGPHTLRTKSVGTQPSRSFRKPARQLSSASPLQPSRSGPTREEMAPFREALRQRAAEGGQLANEGLPAQPAFPLSTDGRVSLDGGAVVPHHGVPSDSPETMRVLDDVFPTAPTPGQASDAQTTPLSTQVVVIGQAMRSYIVAEIHGSLCIIDQHAAHERVLFEQALAALRDRPLPSQGLLTPLTIELTATELAAASEHNESLARLGFTVEPFGGKAVLVRSAPAALKHHDPGRVLCDMLEALSGEGEFGQIRDLRERLAAAMACRAAVKADEKLSAAEMAALIDDVMACDNTTTCPHSRPVLLRMTPEMLERQFGRG